MDHAYYRKTPPFSMEMQTSMGSNFEINCRDRGASMSLYILGKDYTERTKHLANKTRGGMHPASL